MIICLFCDGDSSLLSTWSNVPYFLSTTLEKKGNKVHRVNIASLTFFRKLYNHSISKLLNLFYPNHAFQFERTRFYNRIVDRKIQKYMQKSPDADLYIIMDFSFYNKTNSVPTVTFSDWSYDYLIKERFHREPYYFEYKYLFQQLEALEKATLVISLFKLCADYIQKQVPISNVKFLGGNVINMMQEPSKDFQKIIDIKKQKLSILFIGMKKYQRGAQLLVDTFPFIKKKFPQAELNIIGLVDHNLENMEDGINCYGYLHKDKKQECELYYSLLERATVFVNPTEEWAGYSSMVEAMYYYTPIVVSPYKEFVNEFGKSINFGKYNVEFSIDSLLNSIVTLFESVHYDKMCLNAHERVKDYTWDKYVERFIKAIPS